MLPIYMNVCNFKMKRYKKINVYISLTVNMESYSLITGCLSYSWRRKWQPICLENVMDGGAWRTIVHRVAKSRTRLNDFIFTFIQLYTLTSSHVNICLAYSKVCIVACSFYLLAHLSRVYHMPGPLLGTGLNKMDMAALPSWCTLWSPYVVYPLWVCTAVCLLRKHIKKQRHYFANKGLFSQSYDFSSSHVWMRELDYKES